MISFVEDITNDLGGLNVGEMSQRNHRIMKERFCNIIQVHTDVKQLSKVKIEDKIIENTKKLFDF